MKFIKSQAIILFSVVFLGACAHQPNPEDVTRSFWQAVVHNDLDTARKLTTKESQSSISVLDNKKKMLGRVEVGAARINETTAEVPTTLIGEQNGKETRLELNTFLTQEEKKWKVEGDKTINALMASSLQGMLQNLTTNFSAMGEALNQSITSGLGEFLGELQKSIPQVQKELNQFTDEDKAREIGKELGSLFSKGLQDALKQFSQGMDELSRELDKNETKQ